MITTIIIITVVSVSLFLFYWYYSSHLTNHRKIYHHNKGRYIVIVGASSGIGEQLAYQYAQHGSHLILAARRLQHLSKVSTQCQNLGALSVHIVQLDVTQLKDIYHFQTMVYQYWGKGIIHNLIYCVGVLTICPFDSLLSISNDEANSLINNVFHINTIAPILLTRLFLTDLRQTAMTTSSSPIIIIISSIGGLLPAPYRSLYCSTKFALQGFFNSLRLDEQKFCPHNPVRIQIIAPGTIIGTDLRLNALDRHLWNPNTMTNGSTKAALTPKNVAMAILQQHNNDVIILPIWYRIAVCIRSIIPNWIDWLAMKKYK